MIFLWALWHFWLVDPNGIQPVWSCSASSKLFTFGRLSLTWSRYGNLDQFSETNDWNRNENQNINGMMLCQHRMCYDRMSVCLSVTSWSLIKMAEWMELFLAYRLPLAYPTLCWKGVSIITQNNGTLSETLNLADFSAFLLFCQGTSITTTVVNFIWPITVASLL